MRIATLTVPLLAVGVALPSLGCGRLRRRSTTANAISNVQVNNQGRDFSTLTRDEYEIIETSFGESKQTGVFFLTIPVGRQTTPAEAADSAYYAAVARVAKCDVLLMPRVSVSRVVIPLLVVNFSIRKTRIMGRCAHLKGDRDLRLSERSKPEPEPEPKPVADQDTSAAP